MAAIDFPTNPTNGQTFTAGGVTYIWTTSYGGVWLPAQGTPATCVVSSTPPSNPVSGNLWWNSDIAQLFVYYNDGTSSQWVPAGPAAIAAAYANTVGSDAGCKTTFLTGANVTLGVGAANFTNIVNTGSIGAAGQKWRISATANTVINPGGWIAAQIWDGTNVVCAGDIYAPAVGSGATVSLEAIVTLAAATTFTLRGALPVTNGEFIRNVQSFAYAAANDKVTCITALRLT